MSHDCSKCTGVAPFVGLSRRAFLSRFGMGLGGMALGHLLAPKVADAATSPLHAAFRFAPRAKRVIYLFMSGGPSQMDLFDYKPVLNERNGEQLPDSVRQGQRLTGMSANQSSLPLAGSIFKFARHGQCGAWVSELLPHTAGIVDDLCFIRSMHTDAINHDPAITFFQTGSQISGRPSVGAWVQYGLGSENENLPAFVVLVTKGGGDQPIYARLWGNGFLPARYQGVQLLAGKDPVLYLSNPAGVSRESRRDLLDGMNALHRYQAQRDGDAALDARIEQYEMAFRMQASVPEVADLSSEPDAVFEEYGPDARKPGSFAANCLLARRLAERGVRFIQLFHRGWDQHGNLPAGIKVQAQQTDQPAAALVRDLKRRGMLDDTLVVWGGEFGRTSYSQGALTATDYGRDHHPRCFTMWMAGGGVRAGYTHGTTDDFSYNIAEKPVHVHDFQATLLYLLGLDHERLTYRYQGRDFRLTDVFGQVVQEVLA